MMRKKQKFKKTIDPDIKYNNINIAKFTNYLMKKGKKNVAKKIIYSALDIVKEKTKSENPLEIFDLAIQNVSPSIEVKSKRIGGANYQVPREVRGSRMFALACRWLITASLAKKGKPMAEKLAEELILASKKEGAAVKKKMDVHRMAEANRVFAHFRF